MGGGPGSRSFRFPVNPETMSEAGSPQDLLGAVGAVKPPADDSSGELAVWQAGLQAEASAAAAGNLVWLPCPAEFGQHLTQL